MLLLIWLPLRLGPSSDVLLCSITCCMGNERRRCSFSPALGPSSIDRDPVRADMITAVLLLLFILFVACRHLFFWIALVIATRSVFLI